MPIVERRVGIEQDPVRLVELTLQVAELFEDRLGRDEQATKAYRDVLEKEPKNERALKGLERLYARGERWQDLLDILEIELGAAESERELTLLERMAAMLEEEFLRHEDAAKRLEQVLEIDPTSENALSGLERLYRQLQRWEQLADTHGRHVEAAQERSLKIEHLKNQATVLLENLNDPDWLSSPCAACWTWTRTSPRRWTGSARCSSSGATRPARWRCWSAWRPW